MPALRTPLVLTGLGLWAAVATVAVGSLAMNHTAALPARQEGLAPAAVERAFAQLQTDSRKRLLVHVVASDCSCAQRLTRHVLSRPRLPDTAEVLLLVGPVKPWQALAAAAGVVIHAIDADTLQQRYGLDAAPVLVALAPGGRMDYLGGYFDHPAALHPQDQRLHAQWLQGSGAPGTAPAPLPVYGCAVSPSLRRATDPLGVVYPQRQLP
jgi:hypothetical protein